MTKNPEMRLFDNSGRRLYINSNERDAFLKAARQMDPEDRTLCEVLCFTGCRISEALELTADKVDISEGALVFRTLKKRSGKKQYRSVPIPPSLLDTLNLVHGIQKTQRSPQRGADRPLWSGRDPLKAVSRTTAYRVIKDAMKNAGIEGPQATAKGLRHGYGVRAVMNGIQLDLLKCLMGHADIETTAIYTQAIGNDKREMVSKVW